MVERINMGKNSDSDNGLLVKLRRQYKKDEVVTWCINRVKELRVERGQSNSYINELEHEIGVLKKEISKMSPPTEEMLETIRLYKDISYTAKENRRLEKELLEANMKIKDLSGRIAFLVKDK
jgi:predicted RNase H-like nuclease (RuvC/YqgF family)